MSINKTRGFLYKLAKYLGDIQALKSKRKGAIKKRIARRILGKVFGKTIAKLIK